VVLGHNALYVTVGLVWLFFADDSATGEEVTIRQDHDPYGNLLAAMLGFLIFADNLLKRIEGDETAVWFWLSSGRWELILVSGVLSVVCQLLFWSGVIRPGHRETRGESRPSWKSGIPINVEIVLGMMHATSFLTIRGCVCSGLLGLAVAAKLSQTSRPTSCVSTFATLPPKPIYLSFQLEYLLKAGLAILRIAREHLQIA
jgi:hypothetical protein